ncbi:MAG: Stk1 family PASTA domain-containing Ser/Thr kinase [Oscillospiraceae bacterium]|nr:Stk1 family PASTA domain-containing Ser/Thr kinase [Oscillospiraceae bacterium]
MDNFCGKRLDGRYEISDIIGVGGMAVVYKAYDNIDDRIVAIKILKDEYLTNEEFKRRFKNESKAIAVLSHPNIVRVYNVSFGDRLQYIVEEYVDGITLKEYIQQQGVINWKEAVHFTGQILAALQHAHDKGIVHQDIKPQNIMLLNDGTIKVTDFGIARFSRTDNNTTSENAIGSVHYISPEQARGEMTDDKADIYSVGVVLYEMITGQLPFQSDSAVSVALMQLQKDPVRPRELVPSLPLGLEQITMRAMQKNAADRYQSAAEMLMDINEFKRNPAVKFNYTYFVDKEPTRYIPSSGVQASTTVNEIESEEEIQKKSVNKTTAIMIGAVSGVVVLAIVIFAILSAVGSKKLVVPDFKSLNYYNDIENNGKYKDFQFETKPVKNENFSDGTVVSQDPEANTKVKKGTKITLEVVTNNASVLLDESILNMTEDQAVNYLRNTLMLFPKVEYESRDDVEKGKIIRTEPAIGTQVPYASNVTIYVSSDKKTVKVPKLDNMTVDEAKIALNAVGLEVGKVDEVPSEKEQGRVVSQETEYDTMVPEGTKINFAVSNGNKPDVTVDISVKLLNTQKEGKIIIYVNNEPKLEKDRIFQDNSEKTYQVDGSGSDIPYSVVIDGVKVQDGTIDFNSVNVTTNIYDTLPDVRGKSEQDAKKILSDAKFNNVKVSYKEDAAAVPGTVIEQKPTSDGTARCATNAAITIVIAEQPLAAAD